MSLSAPHRSYRGAVGESGVRTTGRAGVGLIRAPRQMNTRQAR